MREASCTELDHIKLALLETNGRISIMTHRDAQN